MGRLTAPRGCEKMSSPPAVLTSSGVDIYIGRIITIVSAVFASLLEHTLGLSSHYESEILGVFTVIYMDIGSTGFINFALTPLIN